MGEPHVTANHGSFPNCDPAQEGGVAVDGDAVFNDGMAGDVAGSAVLRPS